MGSQINDTSTSAHAHDTISDPVLRRVCGEFLEMPGLRITAQEAQRLWNLDEPTCRRVLEFLVDVNFLYRPGRGTYMRLADTPNVGRRTFRNGPGAEK